MRFVDANASAPFCAGGYRFTGRHANRNTSMYRLFRLGASINDLARTCRLTSGRIRQIIYGGNAGSGIGPRTTVTGHTMKPVSKPAT
jgi:hypothetical protein